MSHLFSKAIIGLVIFLLIEMGSYNSALATTKRSSQLPHSLKKLVMKKEKKTEKKKKQNLPFSKSSLTSRYSSWGINPYNKSSINLLPAWKSFKGKRKIVVAVIDTGIDPNHPFLFKNLYIKNGPLSSNNFGIDFSKNAKNANAPIDQHGHGTHVSGIIKSVYPEVKILSLKYYNPKATGKDNLNSTIAALRYAVQQNVDIINYSGGGPEPSLSELRVLKEAEKKGILIVAAAGNEESNIDIKNRAYYPASYGLKNIITVTAHDQKLNLLSSSNYGKYSVDIAAPGYRIISSMPHSRTGNLTGTSQATAFVTGVSAMIMSQFPGLTSSDIKKIINASARKEFTMLSKTSSGGRLDAEKAFKTATDYVKAKRPNRGLAQRKKKSRRKRKMGRIHYRFVN